MAKETPINRMTLRELRHEYDYEFNDARGDQFSELTDMGFLPPLDAEKTWGKRIYRAKLAAIRALPEDEWDDEFAKSWRNSVGSRNNPAKGRKAGYGKKHPGGSYAGLTSRQKDYHRIPARSKSRRAAQSEVEEQLPSVPSRTKPIRRKKMPGEGQIEAVVIYEGDSGSYSGSYARFFGVFETEPDARNYARWAKGQPWATSSEVWIEALPDVSTGMTLYGVRVGDARLANYYSRPVGVTTNFSLSTTKL